jgi:hypothetical protein
MKKQLHQLRNERKMMRNSLHLRQIFSGLVLLLLAAACATPTPMAESVHTATADSAPAHSADIVPAPDFPLTVKDRLGAS